MGFIEQKLGSMRTRWNDLKYGIVYLRASDFRLPSALWINRRLRKVHFLHSDSEEFLYEFKEICINDCYCLKLLRQRLKKVASIVDIGANQGLFLVAARKNFSNAAVACYEPNTGIRKSLDLNAKSLGADVYYEAVTKDPCRVKLNFAGSDLHTTAVPAEEGEVPGTAFRKVIERSGGSIDILKMDCEGAEWELFNDRESWKNVRSVAMEYHLWAKKGSTLAELEGIIDDLGFTIIHRADLDRQFGILIAVRKAI